MTLIGYWDVARFALGVLIVACNIGVWRGLRLEQLPGEAEKRSGRKLLVASLTLEFCLAMALLVVDSAGSVYQRREVAALNAEVAPRRLTADQQQSITRALAGFSGKNVQLQSYGLDVESAVLGRQLKDVLEAASIGVGDGLMTTAANPSIAFGVHVVGRNGDLARAIILALLNADIDAAGGDAPVSGVSARSDGPATADALVFVGVKPIRR